MIFFKYLNNKLRPSLSFWLFFLLAVAFVAGARGVDAASGFVNLYTPPAPIYEGSTSSLTLKGANVKNCSVDQGVGGMYLGGSVTVRPSSTTKYTVRCEDALASYVKYLTSDATVTVYKPTVSISLSPGSIDKGGSSTLTWSGSYVSSCSIDNGIGSVQPNKIGSTNVSPNSNTTYTITCTNSNNVSASGRTALTVNQPSASVSLSPGTIGQGGSSTLSWSSSYVSSCSIDNGIGSVQPNSGSSRTVNPNSNTTYTISCKNSNNVTASDTKTLTVNPPSASVSLSPSSIIRGGSSTLSWSSSYVSSCSIDNGIGSVQPNSGSSRTVSPSSSTTYTISCANSNNITASDRKTLSVSCTVNNACNSQGNVVTTNSDCSTTTATCSNGCTSGVCNPLPPSASISLSPNSINQGGSSTLSWSSSNISSCTDPVGGTTTSGSRSVNPNSDTTYSISCKNSNNVTASDSKILTVNPPSASISLNKSSMNQGDTASLSWNSSNVSGCSVSGIGSVQPNAFGATNVSPSSDTTYTITCTNSNNISASNLTKLTVYNPSASVSLSPSSISQGGSSTLTWSSSNISSCSDPVGGTSTSGNKSVNPSSNTTYSISCKNSNNITTSDSKTLTVNTPSASVSLSPGTIDQGSSATLSWSSSNISSCSDPVGGTSTSGNKSVNPSSNTTYSISCKNSNNVIASNSTTLTVYNPSASVSLSPNSINQGGSSTLSWSSSYVSSCSIDNGIGSVQPNSGSSRTVNPNSNTTYTISCKNSNNITASNSTTLTVSSPSASISLSPNSINQGGSSTLTWSSSNVSSCSIDNGIGSVQPNSGSNRTVNPSSSTTYTISCKNSNNVTVSDSKYLTVISPTASLSVSNAPSGSYGNSVTISYNTSAYLKWTSSNASSCTVLPGGWTGTSNTSQSTGNLTSSTTYILNCNGATSSVNVTVNGADLSSTLVPNPVSGTSPVNSTLTANISGSALGTINYNFWWNCSYAGSDISGTASQCGSLLTPPAAGACVSNANGYKCDGVSATSQTTSANSYTCASGTCAKTPKIIVERGSAPNATQLAAIMVAAPPLPVPTISASPSSGYASFASDITVSIANSQGYNDYFGWWDCSDATKDVGTAIIKCGSLARPSSGGCIISGNGFMCLDVSEITKTFRSSPYLDCGTTCAKSPKVIVDTSSVLNGQVGGVSAAEARANVAVNRRPTVFTTLTASPSSGDSPLDVNLTSDVTGTASGSVNYSFWKNCSDFTTSVSTTENSCGVLPRPASGSCASNANGIKCDGITAISKTVVMTGYTCSSGTCSYSPKVIVERGDAYSAQLHATVSVNPPPAPTVDVKWYSAPGAVSLTNGPLNVGVDDIWLKGNAGIAWKTTNATKCTASGNWSGNNKAISTSYTYEAFNANSEGGRTFTLTCDGPGGAGVSDSVIVNVYLEPDIVISANNSLNSTSIPYNTSATLNWYHIGSGTGFGTTCTASGDWSGDKAATGGSQSTGNLTASKKYSISCSNSVYPGPYIETVAVNVVSPFAYSLANSGNITSIKGVAGGSNTITVSKTAGTAQSVSLSASQVSGPLPTGVTAVFSPTSCSPNTSCASTLTLSAGSGATVGTYPVLVSGTPSGGTTSFNLIVAAPAPTVSLTVANNPIGSYSTSANVAYNTPAYLNWSSTNAGSCSISPNPGGTVGISGAQKSTGNLVQSQTYTITCFSGASSSGLSATDSVTVNVAAPTLTTNFSVTPTSGVSPLDTTFSANAGGSALGSINYSFWWDCSNTSNRVSDLDKSVASGGCGLLPSVPLGGCLANSSGYKCLAVNTNPQTMTHQYTCVGGTCSYSAKVIVERGSAPPVQQLVPVSVTLPAVAASCKAGKTKTTIGEGVAWTATASGGNGAYTYLWAGSLPLAGKTGAIADLTSGYSSAGNKIGSVTVTSGSQTSTVTCSNSVEVVKPGIKVSPSTISSIDNFRVGDSRQLKANYYPYGCDASGVCDATGIEDITNNASWSSSKSTVAGVNNTNQKGLVTGETAGTAYIYANNYTDQYGNVVSTNVNNNTVSTVTVSPQQPLVCSSNLTTAITGQNIIFTANGGASPYLWSTQLNSGTPPSGTGQSFTTKFNNAGTYTVTVASTGGRQQDSCAATVINPTLSIDSFTASPATLITGSPSTLSVNSSSNVTSGTNNYSFWFNCNNVSTNFNTVNNDLSCGKLPAPVLGSCVSNSAGAKCDGISANTESVSNIYSASGNYTAKVIVEHSSAPNQEKRTSVTVGKVDIKANSSDGPITIDSDTSATLSWRSENVTSCTATRSPADTLGDWSGSKPIGSPTASAQSTGVLSQSGTFRYTIACSGANSLLVNDYVDITVNPTLKIDSFDVVPAYDQGSGIGDMLVEISSNQIGVTNNYTFYCNRPGPDSDITITKNYSFKADTVDEMSYTMPSATCDYSIPGDYVAKVIVERGDVARAAHLDITIQPDIAPTVAPLPPLAPANYCTDPLGWVLRWDFADADGDTQYAYQVVIKDVSNGATVEDTNQVVSPSDSYSIPLGTLDFDKTYSWAVTVWDSDFEQLSATADGQNFATIKHAAPALLFSIAPTRPAKDEQVTLTDTTVVSGGATKSAWNWDFTGVSGVTLLSPTNASTVTVSFNTSGPKNVRLKVTDSDGLSCERGSNDPPPPPNPLPNINIGRGIPTFREVLPR